jgi:hypothetical protein
LRVGGADVDDDDVATQQRAAIPGVQHPHDGATTHRHWSPGGGDQDGPATIRRVQPQTGATGAASIDDADTTLQRPVVHHDVHGTVPMDQPITTLVSEDATQDASWTPPPAFGSPPPAVQVDEAPRRRGVPMALAVLAVLVVAGGAFAAGWLFKPTSTAETSGAESEGPSHESETSEAESESPSHESETSEAESDKAESESDKAESESESDEAEAESEAESDRAESESDKAESESESDKAESESDKSETDPTKEELGELLSYEGFLTVRSSAKAEVYVQGKHIGPTNQRLVSRCYQRFVRLKDADSGKWITSGQPVRIACMASTTVEIEPKP